VTFQGPYPELPVAYAVLHQWLAEHGYQVIGPNREIWLRSGWEEKDPNE
jgi:effector-binding domain-containing protein